MPTGDVPSSDTCLVLKFAYTFWLTVTGSAIGSSVFNEKIKYAPAEVRAVIRLGELTAVTIQHGALGLAKLPVLKPVRSRVLALLRECWGYDCTYNKGDDAFWAGWARARPNARVYIYYIARSPTARLAEALRDKRVANAIVQPSRDRRHNYVPITHWKERIQGAPFLAERSGGAVKGNRTEKEFEAEWAYEVPLTHGL